MAVRIQRKRTKGWKMPENTVYVGRPTKWGNPFRVGQEFGPAPTAPLSRADAVMLFLSMTAQEFIRVVRRTVWLDRKERRALMRRWQKADATERVP